MASVPGTGSFEENARLVAALDLANVGCWELSMIDNQFWLSDRLKSHFHFSGNNIISYENLMALVHHDDRERANQVIKQTLIPDSGDIFDMDIRSQSVQSGTRWLNWKGRATFTSEGLVSCFSGTVMDVTSQIQNQYLLQKKDALFIAMAESSNDYITRWDVDKNLIWANSSFHQKSSSAPSSSEAQKKQSYDGTGKFGEYLQKVIQTLKAQYCDPSTAADGTSLYASFIPEFDIDLKLDSILVIEHPEAEEILYSFKEHETERIATLENLNLELAAVNEEYISTNEELAKANLDLVRSNENLNQFAYVASHDLQEPLRKIQAFGGLLKDKISKDSVASQYVERMQKSAVRMSRLIDDLLDFSRISSKQVAMADVDLNEIMGGVLSDLESTISQAGAVITISELPRLKGDPLQLSQLFQNLLTNAIKFRKAGTFPTIRVNWAIVKASEIADDRIGTAYKMYNRIDVSDDGIGIKREFVDRIFKVFQRLHGKSEYEGTGIGLSICERVAGSHNGIITVESQSGAGSTFSVFLPVVS